MGIYRQEYGHIVEPILRRWSTPDGRFQGALVRDLFLDYVAKGRFAVDGYMVEKFLKELVDEGELEVLNRAPTPSQAAFAGLQYSQASYDRLAPMTPGTAEHHWFKWKSPA